MTRFRSSSALLLYLVIGTALATFSQCTQANGQQPDNTGNGNRSTGQPVTSNAQDPLAPPPDAVRILISGAMLGRLEPCGCASGQLGGLARRMQHIGEQRTYDLLLEGGNLVGGTSELDKLKLFTAAQILFTMERPYDALGVGPRDLELPLDEWSDFLLGAPAIATNLASTADNWPAQPYCDKQVRDHSIRIASLLLGKLPDHLLGEGSAMERIDPAAAWQNAFAQCDDQTLRIAMLHGNDTQIRALIPQLSPRPDLVIGVYEGFIEPDASPAIVGDVPLVFSGIRGRVLLDARLWRVGATSRVACELVPLAGSKTVPGGGGDPDVKSVMMMHRTNVAESNVLAMMADQHPTPNGNVYVGSGSCAGCHPTATKAWQASKHAHAWATLEQAEKDPKRYGWPVTKYPDCVSCHVVGYGQKTGFRSMEETPQLSNVGCERCHGPGSAHVATNGKEKLGMVGGLLASEVCVQCHDFEQSPDFVYGDRWQLIQHGREPK